MSLIGSCARLLDRYPARPLLAALVSRAVRRRNPEASVFYDGMWIHRSGAYYVPDGRNFPYDREVIGGWGNELSTCLRNAADYWFYRYRPSPGDTIVDIGAGRGEDVVAFSRAVGPSGKVIAVEAHPYSFAMLSKFCELNRLDNVRLHNCAVTDRPGTVTISDSDAWEANAIGDGEKQGSGAPPAGGDLEVEASTLDDLLAGEPRIDFLKMNIEGAETRAVLGMSRSVGAIRNICVCCHDFRADRGHGESYRTRAVIAGFLAESGFDLHTRDDDPRSFVRDHLHGTRTGRE